MGGGHNCSGPIQTNCANGTTPGSPPAAYRTKGEHWAKGGHSTKVGYGNRVDCSAPNIRTADELSGPWVQEEEEGGDNPTSIIFENGTTLLITRGFHSDSASTGFWSLINLQVWCRVCTGYGCIVCAQCMV
jgi:hypothetical protein